jgi:DNA-binding beta-propeller fold protein YncE
MSLVSERRDLRPVAVVLATITVGLMGLLAFAGNARAAETLYWTNWDGPPDGDTVSYSDISGSGGGSLNLGSAKLDGPEGMAYDTVTNRLFVANDFGPTGEILAINLDGSGATAFTAPGALIDNPEGVVVDPATRMIYWLNSPASGGSIGWARLDGSAGGLLNSAGATFESPYKLALDPVAGRVYWANTNTNPDRIAYVNVNNSGGGELSITGAGDSFSGLSVDPAAGRIYWLSSSGKVSFASLAGGPATEVGLAGGVFDEPYGLAFDPSLSRLYWTNWGKGEERAGAIGFGNLTGGTGTISPVSAPVNGPEDPVVIKSPTGTGAPTITRNAKVRSELTCSTGTWGADFAGSFVYQAPRSFAYQWSRNGAAVTGATAATLNATAAGAYACTVTATNQAGSAPQGSAIVNVKASKVKLSTKRKAKADPGDFVTFQVKIVNQGDVQSKAARICVKLPNAAKDDLRKPKCKKLRPLGGQVKRTTKFRIKVKPGADEGTDKLTFQVKGTPGKAAKSKIIVR